MRQSSASSQYFVIFLFIAVSRVSCQQYRLLRDIVPSIYDIHITIDLENLKFNGTETIQVHANSSGSAITMHTLDLTVSDLSLLQGATSNPIRNVTFDDRAQTMTIWPENPILSGLDYEIRLAFEGEIRDDMKGLYRSSYYENGTLKYMATTFSAAAYARKIFPCFDEPSLKAQFQLSVTNRANYVTLANTKANRTDLSELNGGVWRTTHFELSPVMSTYLLAFAVVEFGNLTDAGDSDFSVFSSLQTIGSMQYALETSRKSLQTIEEFIGHPYTLSKMDFIAIDDFLMGAMENWGLVSFKSSRIMNPEGGRSKRKIQEITNIITHELVHMFFGNQVTCDYWDYVWLNEGFASYLEYVIADKLLPNWRVLDYFVVNRMQSVMLQDVKPNTHAMTRAVETPEEISKIYDFVEYPKAASVIRMVEHIMKPDVFRKALNSYIGERSFKSATDDHFYEVLNRIREENGDDNNPAIGEIFKSWAGIAGFPILNVEFFPANKSVRVTQELFTLFIDSNETSAFIIPYNFAAASSGARGFSSTAPKHFLEEKTEAVHELAGIGDDERWVIFNVQQTGYYRVNYDTRNWITIIEELHGDNFNSIHELNRAQLLDDSFNLARHGYLDFEISLGLLKYLRNETALLPLTAGFKTIDFLLTFLDKADFFKDLRDILLDIVETIYVNINDESVRVTAENEDYRVLTKLHVNSFACRVGAKSCLDNASTRFRAADFVTHPVDVNERPYLYCGVMAANANNTAHLKMKAKVTEASGEVYRDSQEEFNEIFDAFSQCDSDAARVEQLLNDIFVVSAETLNYEHITKENSVQVIENLIKTSSAHRSLLMSFLLKNFAHVDSRVPFVETLPLFAEAINTPDHLQLFESLSQAAGLDVNETIAKIEENIRWMTVKAPEIAKWVKAEKGAAMKLKLSILTVVMFCFVMFVQ